MESSGVGRVRGWVGGWARQSRMETGRAGFGGQGDRSFFTQLLCTDFLVNPLPL